MKFDEFIASILEALKIRLLENGEEVVLRTNKVLKNNGVELTALNVCRDADEVSPTIYLEPFYRAYMNGMSYEDVLDDIYRLQLMRSFENALSIDAVVNEEHVLDNIIIRLINRKRNEKMLEDISFNAGGDEMPDVYLNITADYVREHLNDIMLTTDTHRYIL